MKKIKKIKKIRLSQVRKILLNDLKNEIDNLQSEIESLKEAADAVEHVMSRGDLQEILNDYLYMIPTNETVSKFLKQSKIKTKQKNQKKFLTSKKKCD